MSLTVSQRAAILGEHLVTCPSHGYSQYSRNGDGTIELVPVDGEYIAIAGGDRDCSSAVISCYTAQGVDCGGATYTGNMRACMVASGNFIWYPRSSGYSARVGDIYLNEVHHAAMCISPYGSARGDLLAQFSISENGTIDGAEGDQTGYESNIKPYYDYPWDGRLHCTVDEAPASQPVGVPGFGDVNWWGPKMAREFIRQLTGGSDSFLSGQPTENKTYFWAVTGGVEYGTGGSDAVRALQRKLRSAGYDPGDVDGWYGRSCATAHQRVLKTMGYYAGDVDGYHGTQTNAAVCRALSEGFYAKGW